MSTTYPHFPVATNTLQWRRDQAIDGTEALELQHLYRAMGWLGEALNEREPDAPSPRRVKDIIEEELFARRRDRFSAFDLVFFDTTSLFFTGNGGDTLGQYGKSKDHRSDCKQMVLGMVIDGYAATSSASPARLHNASGSDCPTPCVRSTLRRRSLTQVPEHRRLESRRTLVCSAKAFPVPYNPLTANKFYSYCRRRVKQVIAAVWPTHWKETEAEHERITRATAGYPISAGSVANLT